MSELNASFQSLPAEYQRVLEQALAFAAE